MKTTTFSNGDFIKVWWTQSDGTTVNALGKVNSIEGDKILVDFGIDSCGHPFENDYLYTRGNHVELASSNEIGKLMSAVR